MFGTALLHRKSVSIDHKVQAGRDKVVIDITAAILGIIHITSGHPCSALAGYPSGIYPAGFISYLIHVETRDRRVVPNNDSGWGTPMDIAISY